MCVCVCCRLPGGVAAGQPEAPAEGRGAAGSVPGLPPGLAAEELEDEARRALLPRRQDLPAGASHEVTSSTENIRPFFFFLKA